MILSLLACYKKLSNILIFQYFVIIVHAVLNRTSGKLVCHLCVRSWGSIMHSTINNTQFKQYHCISYMTHRAAAWVAAFVCDCTINELELILENNYLTFSLKPNNLQSHVEKQHQLSWKTPIIVWPLRKLISGSWKRVRHFSSNFVCGLCFCVCVQEVERTLTLATLSCGTKCMNSL